MKATPIPFKSRNLVTLRDQSRCFRCGMQASDWHHRRSRSIRDNEHSPANGVLLCRTCHTWVHLNPSDARRCGWIVSRYAEPTEVPVLRWDKVWCLLNPSGGFVYMQLELDYEFR